MGCAVKAVAVAVMRWGNQASMRRPRCSGSPRLLAACRPHVCASRSFLEQLTERNPRSVKTVHRLALESSCNTISYACHYCGRTNGARTRDHKVPRLFGGGTLGTANIVRCCQMCNGIKSARHYGTFVSLFGLFLEEHGEEYRAADPDDGKAIRAMSRKFSRWLRTLHFPSTATSPE